MIYSRMIRRSSGVLSQIYANSFNRQLSEGHLSLEAFRFYLEQDTLYLHDYAIALRTISNRFLQDEYKEQFKQLSEDMIATELDVHARYLRNTERPRFFWHRVETYKKIPAISSYTDHLIRSATFDPLPVAVASCLPCFCIYRELGVQMNGRLQSHNRYRDWIRTYSGEAFVNSTNKLIQTTNALHQANPSALLEEQACMSFHKSATFELRFFNAVLAGRQANLPAASVFRKRA